MPEFDDHDRRSEDMRRAERAARQQVTHDEALNQAEEQEIRAITVPILPEPSVTHMVVDVAVLTAQQRIEEMGSLIEQATTVIDAMTALRMQMEEMLAQAEGARDRRTLDGEYD